MKHHDGIFDELVKERVVSLGFQEKGDRALFVSNQFSDMAAAERYPPVYPGEDMCGYE